MAFETALAAELFLVGRVAFGVVLAVMGLNHFTGVEQMAGYAGAKGVPAAGLLVPATGAMLLLGGLGVVLGVYPVLAAGALAVFFLVTTPVMHDFWAVPDDQQQSEMINFQKNVGLFGAALVLFALGGEAWPYALNVGLF